MTPAKSKFREESCPSHSQPASANCKEAGPLNGTCNVVFQLGCRFGLEGPHLKEGGSCMPYAGVLILKQIHKEARASGLGECALILDSAAHQQQRQRHAQVCHARALAALEGQETIHSLTASPLHSQQSIPAGSPDKSAMCTSPAHMAELPLAVEQDVNESSKDRQQSFQAHSIARQSAPDEWTSLSAADCPMC